jgi:hypothetical protein
MAEVIMANPELCSATFVVFCNLGWMSAPETFLRCYFL